MKKLLVILALAGFVGACSSGSSTSPGATNNNPPANAPAAEETVGFTASHSGSFDIMGWAGNSLLEVMSVESLEARVNGYEGLTLALHTFRDMGMAEGRSYEYDSAAGILRLHAAGRNLEITN